MALLPGNALPLLRRDLDEPRQVQRPDLPAQIVVIGTLQDDSAFRLPREQAMQRVLLTATDRAWARRLWRYRLICRTAANNYKS